MLRLASSDLVVETVYHECREVSHHKGNILSIHVEPAGVAVNDLKHAQRQTSVMVLNRQQNCAFAFDAVKKLVLHTELRHRLVVIDVFLEIPCDQILHIVQHVSDYVIHTIDSDLFPVRSVTIQLIESRIFSPQSASLTVQNMRQLIPHSSYQFEN